jgi:protein-L-isoaspartate(D-aspartate) O-methyltransferase
MRYSGIFMISWLMILFQGPCNSQNTKMQDFEQNRFQMVSSQIESRGVKDPAVLNAMRKVPRHLFVPKSHWKDAYNDYPLPIGSGQTISQPYIVAFMTEALELEQSDRVLEIGTGSGYQAAILGEICDSVFTIEIVEELGARAKKTLQELEYQNVFVKIGDGYEGWPEASPFDAIIVTCSPTKVPEPLLDQLSEGGRMIIPVGKTFSQNLYLMEKRDGKLKQSRVLPVRFVPMVKENGSVY